MFKNYFFLNRWILEASPLLKGKKVLSAFTQERDKLMVEIDSAPDNFFLEISVNPGFPYITIRNQFNRAKKNSINIFSEYLPSRLQSVEIACTDRIIKISLDKADIFFTVRGKYTNVYLNGNNGNITAFKNIDDEYLEKIINEFQNIDFTSEYNFPKFDKILSEKTDRKSIQNEYPILGKEILNEAEIRTETDPDTNIFINILIKILSEIKDETPAVFINKRENVVNLAPKTFKIFSADELYSYNSLIDSLNFFIGKKHSLEIFSVKKKKIEKYLQKEIEKSIQKISWLEYKLTKGSREKEFENIGNLLLINLQKVRRGMKDIELEDIYKGGNILVALNEKLSPQRNAEMYFEKAKTEKISHERSVMIYEEVKIKLRDLRESEQLVKNTESLDDLNQLIRKYKMKEPEHQKSEDLKIKFKQYIIENKYKVYVGRDSANNDLLTTKFAKQNDYWFHARAVSGSHVVLRQDTKEPVPKNILKKAASLAAYHSKAKTAGLVPVSYTLKKYVIKRKGMEPGKVALLREETFIVPPEIPQGVEYLTDE